MGMMTQNTYHSTILVSMMRSALIIIGPMIFLSTWDCLCNGIPCVQGKGSVEMDKGDVPIRKEYFQLWYMQGMPYALYDNYAYVTL